MEKAAPKPLQTPAHIPASWAKQDKCHPCQGPRMRATPVLDSCRHSKHRGVSLLLCHTLCLLHSETESHDVNSKEEKPLQSQLSKTL